MRSLMPNLQEELMSVTGAVVQHTRGGGEGTWTALRTTPWHPACSLGSRLAGETRGTTPTGSAWGPTATRQHTQVTHAATCSAHRRATVK